MRKSVRERTGQQSLVNTISERRLDHKRTLLGASRLQDSTWSARRGVDLQRMGLTWEEDRQEWCENAAQCTQVDA